jgi:hypothetical protein
MKGATQGPKWVLMKGFANSTLVLKAGDYFQVGAGVAATRITTSGGSTTVKYYYSTGPSFREWAELYSQRFGSRI